MPDTSAAGCRTASGHAEGHLAQGEAGTAADPDGGDPDHADRAFDRFLACYEARHPKAAGKLIEDCEELMCFFDFLAGHWQSIRTASPIKSGLATIRHRGQPGAAWPCR